ncbi:MAG: orotate phosphoribosyltransferase [Oligoflexus sp.]
MDQKAFHRFMIDHQIIGFFSEPLTLKSGRQSHFYVNWRRACSDAFLLDQLTDYMVEFLQETGWQFDCLYGVPEGATKAAVVAGMKLAKLRGVTEPGKLVIPMGRAKPKEHGNPSDRFFIGAPTGRVVLLEDTITTGLSMFQTLDQLLAQNIQVVAVMGLTDRMERRDDGSTVADFLHERYEGRIAYRTMSQATQVLPEAIHTVQPAPLIVAAIEEELKREGRPLSTTTSAR